MNRCISSEFHYSLYNDLIKSNSKLINFFLPQHCTDFVYICVFSRFRLPQTFPRFHHLHQQAQNVIPFLGLKDNILQQLQWRYCNRRVNESDIIQDHSPDKFEKSSYVGKSVSSSKLVMKDMEAAGLESSKDGLGVQDIINYFRRITGKRLSRLSSVLIRNISQQIVDELDKYIVLE
jgi:hypothetical protein